MVRASHVESYIVVFHNAQELIFVSETGKMHIITCVCHDIKVTSEETHVGDINKTG